MDSPQRQMNFATNEQANLLRPDPQRAFSAPLLGSCVPEGFISSTMGYNEELLDLNDLCVQHPSSTYYVRAADDSMLGAGIYSNDILIVDRSLRAKAGDIVVAALNGDFTAKTLQTTPKLRLEASNDAYSNIDIADDDHFEVFGVVTFVVHATY